MTKQNLICPYVGLKTFEEKEAPIFFGRNNYLPELLKKIQKTRFLSIIGTTGSGKSSLIHAGIIPKLKKTDENLHVLRIDSSTDPINSLVKELNKLLSQTKDSEIKSISEQIIQLYLVKNTQGISEALQELELRSEIKILFVLDQFENLIEYANLSDKHREQIEHFINLMLHASKQAQYSISVVLGIRSDVLSSCSRFQNLPEAINKGQFLMPPLTIDEAKEAILQPASVYSQEIAYSLVEKILADFKQSGNHLAKLQYSLKTIWTNAQKNNAKIIDETHYLTPVQSTINETAEQLYLAKNNNEREKIKQIFQSLIKFMVNGMLSTKVVRLDELSQITKLDPSEIAKLLTPFRATGIHLIESTEEISLQTNSNIQLTHASLIKSWYRLKEWAQEEQEYVKTYLSVSAQAEAYQHGKMDLLTGYELDTVITWKEKATHSAAWAAQYNNKYKSVITFIQRSEAQQQSTLHRNIKAGSLQRVRFFAISLAVIATIAIVTTFYAFHQQKKAKTQEKIATEESILAKNNLIIAEKNKIIATQLLYKFGNLQEENFALLEKLYSYAKNEDGVTSEVIDIYDKFAWFWILNKQYDRAIAISKRGIELDSSKEWMKVNLAIAYLYNGNTKQAQTIYTDLKDKTHPQLGYPYINVFDGNLRGLAEEGFESMSF